MENILKLWQAFLDNAGFVAICGGIALGLYFGARLFEHFVPSKRPVSSARQVSIVAICGAMAAVLMLLEVPLLFLAPEFYKLDLSELPVLLCGFYLGPAGAVACEGIKILLKLLLKGTTTAFVGDFANFTVGCLMVLPAAICYRLRHTRKGAILSCLTGTACMTVLGSAFNAFYLLPKFAQMFGMPLEKIVAMGTAINPAISDVGTFILFSVVPLNLIKGLIVSLLTVLLYKKVARPLFGIGRN